MRLPIRRISTRFAIILAVAAVIPLLAYGFVSIISLQRGTRASVLAGNQNVAARAAEEISRYVSSHADILKALGADLQDTDLDAHQQDRIVKNFILTFREFREITLFDEAGATVATSRVGPPRVTVPARDAAITVNGVLMSPISLDEDQLPTAAFAIHLTQLNRPSGWLVGQFSLEQMWRMVDGIRIGAHGFALVVAPDGTLIAHGDPDQKSLIAQARALTNHPLIGRGEQAPALDRVHAGRRPRDACRSRRASRTSAGRVLVEQPTSEAYANAIALQQQLTVAIAAALLVMIAVGWLFGRRFIAPIFTLTRATQAVAAGQMDARVDIATGDEFQDLGASFNAMADRLVELQEDVKRQERQAMFGRIAAGLVHDLSHPIQNIGNSTRLLLRDDLDSESRELFHRTIDRELATLKRFMDDLRNIVKPKPIERFALDVNVIVSETVDSMRAEGERTGVTVDAPLRRRTAHHRRRPFCAGTGAAESDHQRHPGDRAGRPGGDCFRTRRQSRRDHRVRHRLRDSRRPAGGDFRRVRHDQAAGPRPGPGDLQADCRAARWHHHRQERSGARHRVHDAFCGSERAFGAGRQLRTQRQHCTGKWGETCFARW